LTGMAEYPKYTVRRRMVLAVSAVFQRGKTVIPAEVRRVLRIGDGDKIVWALEDGRIVVESAEQA